jgi:hypothetical protein
MSAGFYTIQQRGVAFQFRVIIMHKQLDITISEQKENLSRLDLKKYSAGLQVPPKHQAR